jgi:hypothetical protein
MLKKINLQDAEWDALAATEADGLWFLGVWELCVVCGSERIPCSVAVIQIGGMA